MRIVDLTMVLSEDTITYPGHPSVEIEKIRTFEEHGKEVRRLEMGTHTGTHIDAPRHYIDGGYTVEYVELETICGPATLVDMSWYRHEVCADALAHAVGDRPVKRLLLRFGGDRLLRSGMDYYTGQPWLTEDAARWLVDRGCRLLGMDTPMPDNPSDTATMPIHKILLGSGVILAEYLVNLSAIQSDTFQLVVAPLKIKEGDGAPARIFAIVGD